MSGHIDTQGQYTAKAAAALLGMSRAAVAKAILVGKMPGAVRDHSGAHGRTSAWRIPGAAIQAYQDGRLNGWPFTCRACGKSSRSTRHGTEYCSDRCANRARRRMAVGLDPGAEVMNLCATCGTAYAMRRDSHIYCSTKCRLIAFYRREDPQFDACYRYRRGLITLAEAHAAGARPTGRPDEDSEIIRLYDAGLSVPGIARLVSRSPAFVRKHLNGHRGGDQ